MALLYGPAARVAIPASMPIRQGGRFASLDVMRPRETRSRNTMAPNAYTELSPDRFKDFWRK